MLVLLLSLKLIENRRKVNNMKEEKKAEAAITWLLSDFPFCILFRFHSHEFWNIVPAFWGSLNVICPYDNASGSDILLIPGVLHFYDVNMHGLLSMSYALHVLKTFWPGKMAGWL